MNLYADLLLTGGPVYTADPAAPWATAVAVRGRHILAVGRAAALADLRGAQTEVVDLHGRLLLPGFTESHIHFVELALRATQIDATQARSAGEVAALVAAAASRATRTASAGESWIRGGGWDANTWVDGIRPHRLVLDAVAPEVPVALDSKELHAVWANTAALRRAGIDANVQPVPGGVIERDAGGEPTGILRENAAALISRAYPAPGMAETSAAVRAATPAMWSAGIVALHNANDSPDALSLRTFQELRGLGALGLRVLQHIPVCNLEHALALGLRSGLGDSWLRLGGVKMFADGALGSRTARMLEPYSTEPDNCGVAVSDPVELSALALKASRAGLALAVHAIGDRANREVLNILAEVRQQERAEALPALRHRIEHAQCLHPDDLPRFAELDVIASVQPIHATSDMHIVDRYWGPERAPRAYPFRSLLDSGARLVFGSDGPIEPHAPLIGIHAAVTRRRRDGAPGPEGWQGRQRITVWEAVDAYTCGPAYAAGEEGYRGSIMAGKAADLVLLSDDISRLDPAGIPDVRIEMTVLDGQVVWRGAAGPASG